MTTTKPTVALIGSFRQHYAEVKSALLTFSNFGIEVLSPQGSEIVEPGIPFVRFDTDDPVNDDCTIQSITLHRIFKARLTYVVAPGGYVGRTTCYEVGRLVQAKKPIYFSHAPTDLPIRVSETHIMTADELGSRLIAGNWVPLPLFSDGDDLDSQLERQLVLD